MRLRFHRRPPSGAGKNAFPGLRRWLHAALACLALSGLAARASAAVNAVEYQLKAGYLYNFAKFIEWPPPPLGAGARFRIGVLAEAEIHEIVEEALRGRRIGEHEVEVVLIREDAEIASCRMLFVPRTATRTPDALRALAPAATVLIVGESEGYAAAGAEIGFVPRGDNLRYQVNLAAAEKSGLKLSARLAGLAEIVRRAGP